MNQIMQKLISCVLAVVMLVTCMPLNALAATMEGSEQTLSVSNTTTTNEDGHVVELSDGYVSISVSKQNGGFLIDTLLGNQLKDSDDNKNLLFESEGYDSSFASFQVTRTDGTTEEYIFGRDYGFLGWDSSDVEVEAAGSSLIATWSVRDLTIVQTLTMMDETNPQHGLVNISYDVTSTKDNVENVKVRVLLDSALGDQDYALYQLYDGNDGYSIVNTESVIENAYENILMSVTGNGATPITAYTINTVVDGAELKPYQVAFGHWANLANTVFDFVPDATRPTLNNPYSTKYLTADSAYALYFDMGALSAGQNSSVSTYYGVYSNATVADDETFAINFIQLPTPMVVKDGSTLESASYHSQVEGGKDGDVEAKVQLTNLCDRDLDQVTVVVRTMNNVATYTGDYPADQSTVEGVHKIVLEDVKAGGEVNLNLFFNLTPLQFSEYRYFEIEIYAGTEVSQNTLMGSNGFYVLCPSVLGEEVSFNTTNPQTIYVEGNRTLYVSGENFSLLQDTSAYTAYLKPVDTTAADAQTSTFGYSGAKPGSTVVPGGNITVDQYADTMNLVVDTSLAPGSYQLVLDWNEEGKADTTSLMLSVYVSDDEAYKNPSFGVVTIEKTPDYSNDNLSYQVRAYASEQAYVKYWNERAAQDPKDNANEMVLLEFRGDFSLKYDAKGNIIEATAISVENADGTASGTISISNALDVECGYVSIKVANPGTDGQSITTDIDGHVYIGGERTTVWNGVCAITSINNGERTTVWNGVCAITSINNGEVNQLVQYYQDGSVDRHVENTTAIANTISLLWPAAAGTAQKFMGVLFDLRYCEFGQMATEYNDKQLAIPADAAKMRVIAFGAIMDPSMLLPSDYDWLGRTKAHFETAQEDLAKTNYNADQLRDQNKRFKGSVGEWAQASSGSLTIIIDDILFGDNRFIGFEAMVEVGIPSYFEGVAGIEGTLHVAFWMLDPSDNIYFEFGVDGSMDLQVVMAEVTLTLKSIGGVPVPDELYLYVGVSPGWNLDCFGIMWLTGLGGGFSGLYDSIVSKSKIPPFTLSMEGGFSLFQILHSRLKANISARSLEFQVKDLGLSNENNEMLTLVPLFAMGSQWYPKFRAFVTIEVSVLDMVKGLGYMKLEENTDTNKLFFEALASCTIKTPDLPIIGSITLGGVDVGLDLDRIFGVMHITKLDLGLCYYYGESVDFSFGKYDVPAPTLLSMEVGQNDKGEKMVLAFGTNVSQIASSSDHAVMLGDLRTLASVKPSITSASDKMHHTVTLGSYNSGDRALTVNFKAESLEEARAIAMGGLFNQGISVTDADGNEYPLTWLDTSAVLTEEMANSANTILSYNEETGMASVSISFTEEADFGKVWTIETSVASELVMYEVGRLADVDSLAFDAGTNTVSWTGSGLEDLDSLRITAVDGNGGVHALFETEDSAVITSGSIQLELPDHLPSGSYTVQMTARDDESNVNDVEQVAEVWNFVNPYQPEDPTITGTALGGDYTIDLTVAAAGENAYDGYVATIYEKVNGEWVATEDSADTYLEVPEDGILTVGGQFKTTLYTDAEGNQLTYTEYRDLLAQDPDAQVTVETVSIGLQEGKEYCVGVSAYKAVPSGNYLMTTEQLSAPITMVKPNPATVEVTGQNKVTVTEPDDFNEDVEKDVYLTNLVNLELTADMAASIRWSLDNGAQEGVIDLAAGSSADLVLDGSNAKREFSVGTGLAEGEHVLKLFLTNAQGDESNATYVFRVDTVAPKIMLHGPYTGSFFSETVTVSGVSEANSRINVALDGTALLSVNTDIDGNFTVDIPMDPSLYEQTVTVNAVDSVGNTSRSYDIVLVNALIADPNAQLALFLNGQDVTGQVIPAGTDGYLELRYLIPAADGGEPTVVTVPHNSSQGSRLVWDVLSMTGSASVTVLDGGVYLDTDEDVNGMLVMYLDKQQLCAALGGNKLASDMLYTVTLPANQEGYTIETNDPLAVPYDGSFSFVLTEQPGYTVSQAKVYVNGVEILPENGVYTIDKIRTDCEITVTGVEAIAAPEITITVSDKTWDGLLGDLITDLLYKDIQEVTITAQDNAGPVEEIYYYLSTEALTEDQVKNLGAQDWIKYEGSFEINSKDGVIVYAKAIGSSTLISYASSDRLVIKDDAPVISGVTDGGSYYGDTTVTVSDPYLESVLLDGQAVELTDGQLVIPADNQSHTITATDKLGNTVTVTFTVYEIHTVSFMVDGQIIGSVQVNHGQDLPGANFPKLPAKTGYDQVAPVWNPSSLENVTTDVTVVAVYTRNVYDVNLPTGSGYTVEAGAEQLYHGEDLTFTVTVEEGYDASNLKVTVNGVTVVPVDGVYTFPSVSGDLDIQVTGVADITGPAAQISVGKNAWQEFLNTVTFGLFFADDQTVEITATDDGSGVLATYYLVSDEPLSLTDLENSKWTAYDGPVTLTQEGSFVVYAKVVDNAGNVTYVSSDGIVIDGTEPLVSGIENDGIYYGDLTFQVVDDNIGTVEVNGEVVYDAGSGDPVVKKQITLKPSDKKQTIVITDKAGNEIVLTVTVLEEDTTVPPTGDTTQMGLYFTLMVLCAIACGCLFVLGKRKRQ